MILVDTSVWVDHLQKSLPALEAALERDEVVVHPFVIGELACGNIKHRDEVLRHLDNLPPAMVVSHEEALHFIERRKLMGKGIGYIDAHLLASVSLVSDTLLWTRDKRLALVAVDLRFAFIP